MWKGILETQPWCFVFKGWTRWLELHSGQNAEEKQWSCSWSFQPWWLFPNACTSKCDLSGWGETNSFIFLYFFSFYSLSDICPFWWLFLFVSLLRIPLIKGKTARENLQEKGLWEQYRKQHPYNPMAKFYQTGIESMTNDADVSPHHLKHKQQLFDTVTI